MNERKTYRVTGVHDGQPFDVEAMVFEEAEREVALTYKPPNSARRADWFWRDSGKRHADHADVPFMMVRTEAL